MKKNVYKALSALVALVMVFTIPLGLAIAEEAPEYLPKNEVLVDGEVVFNDAALQKALENDFMYSYYGAKKFLETVEQLDLSTAEAPITDISVLQLCGKLQTLILDCSQLKSLKPLEKCGKLKLVRLINVGTLSIEPLISLKNLTTLMLEGEIADLSPIADMKKLDAFSGINLGQVDFTPLANAPKLSMFVYSNENANNDISPLADAKKLTSVTVCEVEAAQVAAVLEAQAKNIKELTIDTITMSPALNQAIGACGKLTKLSLYDVSGVDMDAVCQAASINEMLLVRLGDECSLAALGSLKKLETLAVYDTPKVSFKGLDGLPKVKTLTLGNLGVDDLGFFANLPSLERLEITLLKGASFPTVEKLPKLKDAILGYTDKADISFIAAAPKLAYLRIEGCRPESFAFMNELACLKSLTNLGLFGLSLDDFSFVGNMPKLVELALFDTEVKDISAIADAGKLKYAYLYGNPIEDYQPLKKLKKLESLLLSSQLDSVIVDDLKQALPKVYFNISNGADMIDAPYTAAMAYGDTEPVPRDRRTAPEIEAGKKAVEQLLAEKQAENAAKLREVLEKTKETDGSLFKYYWNDSRYDSKTNTYVEYIAVSGNVKSTDEVIRIPESIDGKIVNKVDCLSLANYNSNNTLKIILLPATIEEFRMSEWSDLEAVIADPENPYITSLDGVLYTKDMKTLLYCPPKLNGGTDYAIPDGVETVAVGAILSDRLSVSIPAGVTDIVMTGEGPYDYNYMAEVSVAEDNPAYASPNGLLTDKAGRKLVLYPTSQINYQSYDDPRIVSIPEGIESIGVNALHKVSYNKLIIPASLVATDEASCWGKELDMNYNYHGLVFEVAPSNPVLSASSDGYSLMSKDQKVIHVFGYEMKDYQPVNSAVTIPDGVISVAPYALNNIAYSATVINIPAGVSDLGVESIADGYFRDWKGFNVDDNNTVYSDIDGVLFSADKKELLLLPPKNDAIVDGRYEVPEGTEVVTSTAFDSVGGLKELVLSETVTKVEDGTFVNLYCERIVIPASVTDIGKNCFYEKERISDGIYSSRGYAGTVVITKDSYIDKYLSTTAKGDDWLERNITIEYK